MPFFSSPFLSIAKWTFLFLYSSLSHLLILSFNFVFTSILLFFYFSPFGQQFSPFPIFQLLSLSNTLLFYILSTMMISSSPIIGEHLSSSIGGSSSRRNGPASAGSTFTSSSPLGGPLANNPNGRIPSSPRSPQQQQRHSSVSSSRHTIHPKLSLSAKRSTASMTAGGTAQQQQQNGHGASTSSFQLTISFSNAETGAPITFKQDGSRFQTSQRTMKLQSNCKYKVNLKTQPPQDFLSLHIGGSDLELVNNADGQAPGGGTGQYMAMWNTTGIDPSKKGLRQDILFVLAGPGKTLSRKLQTKFYRRQDSHAGMGHRLDALIWSCEADPIGQVAVTDEKLL